MRAIFIWIFISFNLVFACDQYGITGLVEENDLWIGPDVKSKTDLSEEEFEKLLDNVEAVYGPEVKSKGGNLVVERNWNDGVVNAYAYQEGNNWHIVMTGGLARHETITRDGMYLAACHEIGHHLGGAPKKSEEYYGIVDWASNEGQADYFGTLKCLKKVWEKENNVEILKNIDVDQFAATTCKKQFRDTQDIAICERAAMAGKSVASLFNALRRRTIPLRFDTPDENFVRRTFHGHPEPQCRLDTYFSGAVCNKDPYTDFSDDLASDVGACTKKEGAKFGARPNCWFGTDQNLF
ncbi:MAG: hypothetical protein ACHQYQ_07530 [Bacteriovoracales bacterium]